MRSRSSSSLDEFPGLTLEQLDQRSALLKRTDTKYVLDAEAFAELLSRLGDDHAVLEIDGRREFSYQSVYFDTPQLRCFRDHVHGNAPRFKARTRLYRDTNHCVFEVKLKLSDGDTDKRQVPHPAQDPSSMHDDDRECLEQALSGCGMHAPAEPLGPSLRTTFTRITLAPADFGGERTTCDKRIVLERTGGGIARLRDGLVVVESKSESGEGPTDRAMRELAIDPVSLSKYRTGIALLAPQAERPDSPRQAERHFSVD